ncbi:MAG: HAMP domain-containing histidine kinase [Catenulispora sp.]|nr:HAMP domain-containing histidine kinase [Catenulispora sp.]
MIRGLLRRARRTVAGSGVGVGVGGVGGAQAVAGTGAGFGAGTAFGGGIVPGSGQTAEFSGGVDTGGSAAGAGVGPGVVVGTAPVNWAGGMPPYAVRTPAPAPTTAADAGADTDPASDPGEGRDRERKRRRFPFSLFSSLFTFWRTMPLRARLALAATVAVVAGVGGGVTVGYLAVRHELMQHVDEGLYNQARRMQAQLLLNRLRSFPDRSPLFGETQGNWQLIAADGTPLAVYARPDRIAVVVPTTQRVIPVSPQDAEVAAETRDDNLYSTHMDQTHIRVLTLPAGNGHAVQISMSLAGVDRQLSTLGWQLFGAGMAGIVLAAGLGWLVARTALRPVAELTGTAERITATHDLAHRIPVAPGARDELGRLAASFNSMLDAVQEATDRQRQLVADASHELRTPLTSLRTNVEVLADAQRLDPEDRRALVAGIMSGLDDLTALVTDTVELARGEEQADHFEEVRLDLLVRRCVDRAAAHWPKAVFQADLAECEVVGVSDRLAKAVRNLLDNAAKFSPDGGLVEVRVSAVAGQVTLSVRDHGPGIPEADLPHVFDRFYRAASARDLPGSGLGLAIVAQVAAGHGGGVNVRAADGGGAEFRLTLPMAPAV